MILDNDENMGDIEANALIVLRTHATKTFTEFYFLRKLKVSVVVDCSLPLEAERV